MTQDAPDIARDLGHAIAKSAPPVTVWALTLNEYLAIASIIYVAAQLAHLIWKWRREAQRPSADG